MKRLRFRLDFDNQWRYSSWSHVGCNLLHLAWGYAGPWALGDTRDLSLSVGLFGLQWDLTLSFGGDSGLELAD